MRNRLQDATTKAQGVRETPCNRTTADKTATEAATEEIVIEIVTGAATEGIVIGIAVETATGTETETRTALAPANPRKATTRSIPATRPCWHSTAAR